MTNTQLSMFPSGEDTPLFSGTCQRIEVAEYGPKPQPRQQSMAQCNVCLDTGRVVVDTSQAAKGRPCWCEAGSKVQEAEIVQDCRLISSGTIAGLTGFRRYSEIETIQATLISWVQNNPGWASWQDAFDHFWAAKGNELRQQLAPACQFCNDTGWQDPDHSCYCETGKAIDEGLRQIEQLGEKSVRYIEDPGHGWLAVPVNNLKLLGIVKEITSYSFISGGYAYLEEDVDLGIYLDAFEHLAKRKWNWDATERQYVSRFNRGQASYHPSKVK